MSAPMSALFDALQAEFCPPLDTSLLAALIADLDHTTSLPLSEQVNALRVTLKELAFQASAQHDHELEDELDSAHLSSLCLTTDDSASNPDFCGETTESSTTSDSSAFSPQSFSSPLGFLRAALPHIPQSRLRRALSDVGAGDDNDVDMESVVETILTSEFICELEERGLDALDDELSHTPLDDDLWERVELKKKPLTNTKAAKKKNARGKTLVLVDIRQKHHLPPSTPNLPPTPDPWTQLSSLSEHLATLLPPLPPSYFQSFFHSPKYSSPAKALRAALSSIVGTKSESPSETSTRATLFAMFDVLCDSPAYTSLDPERRSTLYADAQLALRATRGRGDDAIDIVWLLLEFDIDLGSGTLALGVYHSPQSSPSSSRSSVWVSPSAPPPPPLPSGRDRSASTSAVTRQLPSGPPPVQPPPTSKRKGTSSSPGTSPVKSQQALSWQTVPQKPHKGPHPLALHIPAYDSANQSRRSAGAGKIRGTGNGLGKGGKGDVGELTRPGPNRSMTENLRKRDELLREASKAWNRGSAKTRGGEVALYLAERARELQELARREALDEARTMVESKRAAAVDRRAVDLHGTLISEAISIVKEILEDEGCSAVNPLRIITGRGTHSANGVSVLKPAVRNALVRDGWNVGIWDGGLVVRGRT